MIYSLLSHTTAFLPYQLHLIKKHVDLGEIFFVTDGISVDLDIKTVQPPESIHRSGYERTKFIVDWLFSHIDEPTLVLHGDMLPIRPIDVRLMNGKGIAGYGSPTYWHTGWRMQDPNRSGLQFFWHYRDEEHVLEFVPELKELGYKHDLMQWHIMADHFLHCHQMQRWGDKPERDSEQLRLLGALYPEVSTTPVPYTLAKKRVWSQEVQDTPSLTQVKLVLKNPKFRDGLPSEIRDLVSGLISGCGCDRDGRITEALPQIQAHLDAWWTSFGG